MTFLSGDPPAPLLRLHDGAVLLYQVIIGMLVLVTTLIALALGTVVHVSPLMLGLVLVFAATGTAFIVPWGRSPIGLVLVLPLIDIIAVMLMTIAAPDAAFPLLWMFLAMWVGSSLGMLGVLAGTIVITAAYWFSYVVAGQQDDSRLIILPIVVAGLAAISSVASWRSGAQRIVLEKQSLELRRAVERARGQEDLVTEVLDAVDFGVIRLTGDGEMVVTNEAQVRLQRLSADADSAYDADGLTPLDPDELPLERARRGEDFGTVLVWFGEPGQVDRRAVRFTSRRVDETARSFGGTIIVAEDITAEELALRAREDLIVSVSHELRTPLTSITGYADLVLETPQLPVRVRRNVEVIERNADRLLALVSDLLSATTGSKMGLALNLDPQHVELTSMIGATVESALPRAAERDMTIQVEGTSGLCILADPHRIRQVLDNLISNAIKYGDTGGHIAIRTRAEGERAIISVSDDGPGIPQGEIARVFDRFFRSALVRSSATHGTGLGLSISRDIVRAHSGDLSVRSVLGEGAEFTVRLPLAPHGKDA